MKSGKFVWGVLVGLVIGVGATMLSHHLHGGSRVRLEPLIRPAGYVVVPQSPLLPPGWHQYRFNGQPYYFVPLGLVNR